MTRETILEILEGIQRGETSPADALARLAKLPYEDAGFAKIDHHRSLRLGLPEVIYSKGKTPAQVAEIFSRMARGGGDVIATRAGVEAYEAVRAVAPEARFHERGRGSLGCGSRLQQAGLGPVAVVCAGTSDLPVAEEAAVTAEYLGLRGGADCGCRRGRAASHPLAGRGVGTGAGGDGLRGHGGCAAECGRRDWLRLR